MRRFVDHVLCSLPFEQSIGSPTWLPRRVRRPSLLRRSPPSSAGRGIRRRAAHPAGAAGHDSARLADAGSGAEPGHFLQAARRMRHARLPHVRFAIASFRPAQAEFARAAVKASGLPSKSMSPHAGADRGGRVLHGGFGLGFARALCTTPSRRRSTTASAASPTSCRASSAARLHHAGQPADRRAMFFVRDPTPYDPDSPADAGTSCFRVFDVREQIDAVGRPRDPLAERSGRTCPADGRGLEALRARVGHGGALARPASTSSKRWRPLAPPSPRPHFLPHRLEPHRQAPPQAA